MPKAFNLPPQDEIPSEPEVQSDKLEFGSDRLARRIDHGHYVYVIRLRMQGSNFTSLHFLTHHNSYNQEELDSKVAEACKICIEGRIGHRRQEMADQKIPVPEPIQQTNENLFTGDADFVEVVMCDKWGFRKLSYRISENEIQPTVRL